MSQPTPGWGQSQPTPPPWGAPQPPKPKQPTPWVAILLAAIAVTLVLGAIVNAGEYETASSSNSPGVDIYDRSEPASREQIGDDASRVADDLDAISAAAGAYDLSGVQSACAALASDVATAQSRDLSGIESNVAALYRESLSHFRNAAAQCMSGGMVGLNAAASEIAAGTAAINQANDLLR
jgi:hypothetical protein